MEEPAALEALPNKSNPAAMELTARLMDTMATETDFGGFEDGYEKKIRQLITAMVVNAGFLGTRKRKRDAV